jgi:hypothetical protein
MSLKAAQAIGFFMKRKDNLFLAVSADLPVEYLNHAEVNS